jgi:hypothetical protein
MHLYEIGLSRARKSDASSTSLILENNLAAANQAAGRTAEAINLFSSAVEAAERVLGPGHPSVLTYKANLASAYMDYGRVGTLS